MIFVLFVVAAACTIGGLLWDNSTVITIGWVGWALGLASAFVGWRRRQRPFGSVEAAHGAAEAGNPRAMLELALHAKVDGDLDEAERLLRAAIDRGDVDSMWELGRLVEGRDGLAASEPWYRMAADHGHRVAREFFKPGYPLNLDGDNPL